MFPTERLRISIQVEKKLEKLEDLDKKGFSKNDPTMIALLPVFFSLCR